MHQNHLRATATAREQQGRDGQWLRSHYQKKLGFNDSEMSNVNQTASRLASELKQVDDQVNAVVAAYHARYPRQLAGPDALPPVPPELFQLGTQREEIIKKEVDRLRESLGTERSAKLDHFLQTELASGVTTQRAGHPRPHDPKRYPAPPFSREVQK